MRTEAGSPSHIVGAVPRSFVPPAVEAHEYECPEGAANTQAVVLAADAQTAETSPELVSREAVVERVVLASAVKVASMGEERPSGGSAATTAAAATRRRSILEAVIVCGWLESRAISIYLIGFQDRRSENAS